MKTLMGLPVPAEQDDYTLSSPLRHVGGQGVFRFAAQPVAADLPQAAALFAEDVSGAVLADAAMVVVIAAKELRHSSAYRDADVDRGPTSTALQPSLDRVRLACHAASSPNGI
jgi:hypothetical protein